MLVKLEDKLEIIAIITFKETAPEPNNNINNKEFNQKIQQGQRNMLIKIMLTLKACVRYSKINNIWLQIKKRLQ